jgi:hypothetical protein
MVTGEPVNISRRSHGLCVAGELDSRPDKTSSRRSHGVACDGRVGLDV